MRDDNERILMQRRGVPAKAMTKLEAMMDPTNPNVFEANDNDRRIAELEAENRRMREALEGLLDVQNDAPLGIREEEWKQAVERARAALSSERR